MSALFTPFRLRELTIRNRVFVSPMCQYSAANGVPNEWHFVHLGSRAIGGAGLVMAEATAVEPAGRITPADTGLWNDEQARPWARTAAFIAAHGAVPAIQLAHAGRKASTAEPWNGGKPLAPDAGAWETLAPSAIPFDEGWPAPRAMDDADLVRVKRQFVAAAVRARSAGFRVVELHMAHGYLLHEFLSPLTNRRDDRYGGALENRMRFPLEVAHAVRETWPDEWPVFVRISATDWAPGGWDVPDSVEFARRLREAGIDLVDCSSGGLVPHAHVRVGPGYQVPFAAAVRRDAGVPTAAVGMITAPQQAEDILARADADAVFLARAMLRDPYWAMRAAHRLGDPVPWPKQYLRADPID